MFLSENLAILTKLTELKSKTGYNVFLDNSPVGVAILLKNNISFEKVFIDINQFQTNFIQIKINKNSRLETILIGSVYIPTNLSRESLSGGLNVILETASRFDGLILGGDFNAKNTSWGDHSENMNGKTLYNWLQDHTLEVTRLCDIRPSYPNGDSFLDHFLLSAHFVNREVPNFRITSLPTFSDHFPLKLELRLENTEFILNPARFHTSYKKTNWNNFRRDIDIAMNSITPPENRNLSNNEIDVLINEFNYILNSTASRHSEKIELRRNKTPLPENIKKMLRVKHQWQKELKKIYHRTGNRASVEYNILSKQIGLLRIILKDLINMNHAQIFSNKLENIKPGPSAFREIYNMVGKGKSGFCSQIIVNDTTISNDSEISEAFRSYYSDVYSENLPVCPVSDLSERVSSYIADCPRHIYSFDISFGSIRNDDSYHFTNPSEIKQIINCINNKKSHGVDNIPNFLIKKLPDSSLRLLSCMFNNCLNNCYFPKAWKTSKIIPIEKKNNSTRIEEFRPISLLSNVGKIFEHILKKKIENEFAFCPLPPFQFGFRRQHSTQHALLKLHTDVTKNLREKRSTVAISLDIEKAFDSACHKGILYKLADLGVDPFLVKLLANYFMDREFYVGINNSSSCFGNVKSGVPQGSVLAPLLFNIFLYDFPHTMAGSKAILYADDCMIYSHNEFPLRALTEATAHLHIINDYYNKWGIRINTSKSEAICIRNASGKCHRQVVPQSKNLSLSLGNSEIPFKPSIKYLGVHFNKLMKFNNHSRYLLAKAKKITGIFSRVMHSKFLPQRTKLLLYKVAIRPVLTYAFPIWFTISPVVAKDLEIFERSILRKCLGKNFRNPTRRFPNSYIYENSDITPLCTYALTLQKRFVEHLEFHDNHLMIEIFESERYSDWNNSTYLSPIGIVNLDHDAISHSQFFLRTAPGSHRG
ncbi:RNA-directed DNA polymerase from mobile element jockey [Lucilia cuprina]|nr:RNA-directed DNA polymerase from mobile element jockey [Lucilia cuprina]